MPLKLTLPGFVQMADGRFVVAQKATTVEWRNELEKQDEATRREIRKLLRCAKLLEIAPDLPLIPVIMAHNQQASVSFH